MKRYFVVALVATLAVFSLPGLNPPADAQANSPGGAGPAPEFTHTAAEDWINSPPLTLAGLRGKVVLLDFWTFGCWNCYRSFPWLTSMEEHFSDRPFTVIGVHTPEFDHEKDRDRIVAKTKEFKLPHPVMIDNDFSYWRAMGNRYWPTYYLIDKKGTIRATFIGETHAGTKRADAVQRAIEALLAEPAT